MPAEMFVGPLIEVLRCSTGLLEQSTRRKKARFEILMEPLYTDLAAIHKDYLLILTKLKQVLEEEHDFVEARKMFEMDRMQTEALRDSVKNISQVLSTQRKLLKYKTFLEAICAYFHSQRPMLGMRRDTRTSMLLAMMVSFGQRGRLRKGKPIIKEKQAATKELLEVISNYIKEIKQAWAKVSTEYGKVLHLVA